MGIYKSRCTPFSLVADCLLQVVLIPYSRLPTDTYPSTAFYRNFYRAFPISAATTSAVPVVDSSLPLARHKSLLLALSVLLSKLNCPTHIILYLV